MPSAALHEVDRRRFRFDWHSAELAGVSVVRYDLSATVHSTAEPVDQFLACRVAGPDARVRSARDDLDADLPWLTDGAEVEARWEDETRVTALVFDRATLQSYARQVSGDDRLSLRVSALSPRTPAAAGRWNRMFSYLEDSLGDDETDALLRAELARHASAVTLSTFPTSMDDSLRSSAQSRPAPQTVRRALSFIEDNAHLPITIDDVAEAVHISTRGLQYAFRRALGTTPSDALRRARLDGARRQLLSDDTATVAQIARRWGYTHPSRFSAAYRAEFGTLPSANGSRRRV